MYGGLFTIIVYFCSVALATVGGIVVDGRAYPHSESATAGTRSPIPTPLLQNQQVPGQQGPTTPVQHQVHQRLPPQQPPMVQHQQQAGQQVNASLTIRPGSSHQVCNQVIYFVC